MIALVNTSKGTKKVRIKKVKTSHTPEQLDRLQKKFVRETRCIEWVGGVTYYFMKGSRSVKSSSLDELFEMYKASAAGLPIPERKCFFYK